MNPRFTKCQIAPGALWIVVMVPIALACGGCELIPLATLGAVFDIAGSTVSAGPAIWSHGKLDIAFMADYPRVQEAVRSAAGDLDLHLLQDRQAKKHECVWTFQLQDDLKSKIDVTVERRTTRLCRCRVDVGFFGSEPTARLLMERIAGHLPPPETRIKPV